MQAWHERIKTLQQSVRAGPMIATNAHLIGRASASGSGTANPSSQRHRGDQPNGLRFRIARILAVSSDLR